MRDVHDPALRPDRPRRVVGLQTDRDALVEEQADDLAGVGAQLLADDHAARQAIGELDRALDRVVIGDAQHVDARLGDRRRDLVGRRRRVAAPHRVAVHVDAHPTGRQRFAEVRMTGNRCRPKVRARAATVPRRLPMCVGHIGGGGSCSSPVASGFLGRHLGDRVRGRRLGAARAALDHDRHPQSRAGARRVLQLEAAAPSSISPIARATGGRSSKAAATSPRRRRHAGPALSTSAATRSSPAGRQPYRENDSPFPITDYGVMKLEAERAVSAECPGAVIVRTSLLYGTTSPGQDPARRRPGDPRQPSDDVLHRRVPLPGPRRRRRRARRAGWPRGPSSAVR